MQNIWLIRPVTGLGFDESAWNSQIVSGEFGVKGDLSDHFEPDMLTQAIEFQNPSLSPRKLESLSRQLYDLLFGIAEGDYIIHPAPGRKGFVIGVALSGITMDHQDRPARHVDWITSEISKSKIKPDLLHSLASGLQVCQISRANVLHRVQSLIETGEDPGDHGGSASGSLGSMTDRQIYDALFFSAKARLSSLFAGHDMALLVASLLELDGYKVLVSQPGPDGGCDLVAGRGTLGFDGPTIAAQVKSGDIVADHATYQSLIGVMTTQGADRGLLVSWSGVTRPVASDVSRQPLRVKIWTGDDITRRVIERYSDLPLWIRDRFTIVLAPVIVSQFSKVKEPVK